MSKATPIPKEKLQYLYAELCVEAGLEPYALIVSDVDPLTGKPITVPRAFFSVDLVEPDTTAQDKALAMNMACLVIPTNFMPDMTWDDGRIKAVMAHEHAHIDQMLDPTFLNPIQRRMIIANKKWSMSTCAIFKVLEHDANRRAFQMCKSRALESTYVDLSKKRLNIPNPLSQYPTMASSARRLKRLGDKMGLPPLEPLPR